MTGRKPSQSPEVKAAVLAALMAGQSISSIAREFNIPRTTINSWKESSAPDDYAALVNIYLQEALKTLAAQQIFFRTESWLEGQSASDLAVLHGVTADKVIRILEAAENGRSE